jgi:hypothetical protein
MCHEGQVGLWLAEPLGGGAGLFAFLVNARAILTDVHSIYAEF